jgi:hypothetical protein
MTQASSEEARTLPQKEHYRNASARYGRSGNVEENPVNVGEHEQARPLREKGGKGEKGRGSC